MNEPNMRLISLDIDGPLHPVSAITGLSLELGSHGLVAAVGARDLFRHRHLLESLLAEHPDVTVAVHSSWRLHVDNSTLRQLLGDELSGRLVGITSQHLGRQAGIDDLVERAQVDHLLVIDDDREAFEEFYEPLLLVDPEAGLSDPAVQSRIATWLKETAPQTHRPPVSSSSC